MYVYYILTHKGHREPYRAPIQSKHRNILIDCGSGVFSYLQKIVDFNDLDAVFISHMHPDHFIDLIAMRYAMRYSDFEDRLNVYVPKSAISYLHQLSSSLSLISSFYFLLLLNIIL